VNEKQATRSVDGVRERIRTFVLGELAPGKGVTSVTDDESLVDRGVVDSLGIFQLVSFLEEAFRVRIADEEITQDNFRTIDSIDAFVTTKLNG
jgi:acyl carrier protein